MPFNGSGLFNLLYNWQNDAAQALNISSSRMQNQDADIASGLSDCVTKDGQTTPTANLPMGNFRHINVANAALRSDYAAAGQVQDSAFQWLTGVSGTDTITATAAPAPSAYAAGQTFRLIAVGANTTNAVTLNINGLGAKSVTKFGTQVLSAGDILSGATVEVVYDGTQFQITNIIPARSGYSVRGLVGANNTGSPTTKMDFSANAVTLINPTTGESITRLNTGTITCDTGLAGPAANGRDQAGAFAASTWLHYYFIWNGQTLATIVSTVAPPTGPTLPTGYTHWAYIGSAYFNASSQLLKMYVRGKKFTYAGSVNVLAGGSATNSTPVSLSTAVPPNAEMVTLYATLAYYDSGTLSTLNLNLYLDGATVFAQIGITEPVSNTSMKANGTFDIPNAGQSVSYAWDSAVGTRSANLAVLGYFVPNGG